MAFIVVAHRRAGAPAYAARPRTTVPGAGLPGHPAADDRGLHLHPVRAAAMTWVIFGVWLAVVLAFYLALGPAARRAQPRRRRRQTGDARAEMTIVVGHPTRTGRPRRRSPLGAMLARSLDTDLRVVTVVPAPWPTPVAAPRRPGVRRAGRAEPAPQAVAEAKRALDEVCRRPRRRGPSPCRAGRCRPPCSSEADRRSAPGWSSSAPRTTATGDRVVVGSTADRLLHSAHVPVAVATAGLPRPRPAPARPRDLRLPRRRASRDGAAADGRDLCGGRGRAAGRHVRRARQDDVPARGARRAGRARLLRRSRPKQRLRDAAAATGLRDVGPRRRHRPRLGRGARSARLEPRRRAGRRLLAAERPGAAVFVGSNATRIIRHCRSRSWSCRSREQPARRGARGLVGGDARRPPVRRHEDGACRRPCGVGVRRGARAVTTSSARTSTSPTGSGEHLRPCEMPAEKVLAFLREATFEG